MFKVRTAVLAMCLSVSTLLGCKAAETKSRAKLDTEYAQSMLKLADNCVQMLEQFGDSRYLAEIAGPVGATREQLQRINALLTEESNLLTEPGCSEVLTPVLKGQPELQRAYEDAKYFKKHGTLPQPLPKTKPSRIGVGVVLFET